MAKINDALFEQYQQIFLKDPQAQIFAPLAEGYRERGLLREAEMVLKEGLKKHPSSVTGLVVLAKVLRDLQDYEKALLQLEQALALAPENLLAHQIQGEVYLLSKQPKLALKAFKMLLFLNPQNIKAQTAVKKLESLTADEYEEDVFQMGKLSAMPEPIATPSQGDLKPQAIVPSQLKPALLLERAMSLIDAFIVRNELQKAKLLLEDARKEFGDLPEISKRFHSLQVPSAEVSSQNLLVESRSDLLRDRKIRLLKNVLRKIESYQEAELTLP